MPVYRTQGKLTHPIAAENVPAAQRYLELDHDDKPNNMHQYLDAPLEGVIELLEWRLDGNGHDYVVTAFASRELSDDELKQLASEVSGQNSDGLGEGFEQQDFAEWGTGGDVPWYSRENPYDDEVNEESGMCSFDWETNDSTFVRVG